MLMAKMKFHYDRTAVRRDLFNNVEKFSDEIWKLRLRWTMIEKFGTKVDVPLLNDWKVAIDMKYILFICFAGALCCKNW